VQWRRQDFVAGGSEVRVYRGSRVRSPPVPVVLSVCQRGSLLDGLAMYLSCDTKKFHDNESTHILHNLWTSTHRGEALPFPLATPLIHTDIASDSMRAATMHQCQQCMRWARQATARAIYRVGQKSKLLILSERVNNTEKTGGM